MLNRSSLKPTITQVLWDQLTISSDDLLQIMRAILEKGLSFRFSAKGSSMLPFIHGGDTLTIIPLSLKKPSIGRVVAFTIPPSQNLMVHRIIAARSDRFLIKADNSLNQVDGWIPKNCLLGCLSSIESNSTKINFSLGIERILIAFLSRYGLLTRIVYRLSSINHKLPTK